MSPIRSGLVALIALSCVLIGTADGAQAATAGKHNPEGRSHSPSASSYGNGPGSKAHLKCRPSYPQHTVATTKPTTATAAKNRGYCPPGGTLPQFSLTVTNNSSRFEDLVLYQKPDDLGVRNAFPVAWLTAPAHPGTTVRFTWTQDYSFVWSQTGPLRPGVTFSAQQTVATDPQKENDNHTRFEFRGDTFAFIRDDQPGRPGSLTIREQSSVPPGTAAVGIGMANEPTFAVQAEPNTNLVLTPHPDYWVTAGTYTHGEVLDTDRITSEAHLPYDHTFAMSAVLDAAGNWTVQDHG
jgi:hypothetical protein